MTRRWKRGSGKLVRSDRESFKNSEIGKQSVLKWRMVAVREG